MRVRLLVCAVMFALAAAACGADDAATTAEPASTGTDVAASAAPASPAGDVPDLDMADVHTGETVNLQSTVSSETPTLLWFWAPH
ncbi:MAG: hypothetical protein F4017_01875 [Acidimicrobiaceae bacterium]|nr:hypothetical protein [Acidimicrobiaceae bacterium]MYK73332.1 hypothetical protein [Acidimicrobiaceae bacterium]